MLWTIGLKDDIAYGNDPYPLNSFGRACRGDAGDGLMWIAGGL